MPEYVETANVVFSCTVLRLVFAVDIEFRIGDGALRSISCHGEC